MNITRQHPYADFVHKVKKPARYLGGEHGEIAKDWQTTYAKVCLAFPDVYEVGMSHLGFKILYSILNGHPRLLAERAYAPWVDMEVELRARNEPLRSLETFRALSEFDVVGFSLQFELTFTNILQMLELGGIAIRSSERQEDAPLVIAGGPTATHPEPLSAFIDAFLIGDGEERTPEIALLWKELSLAGLSRSERLRRIGQLPGLYVPSMYETERDELTGHQYVARAKYPELPLPVQRTFVSNISDYPFPKTGPIATTETVFDRVSVEIARGCTEGCRFCQAGMIYRPVRERDPEEIIDVLRHAVREGGYDGASLTSLSTADYSAISPLVHRAMEELRAARATLSVSSLRAYGLDEDVLDEIKDGGGKGLTFAPEAGTQRMRDVVNKNVTEEQLMETARRVFSRGYSRMKLYFMIGLPTETDEDVLGIVETGARAQAVGRQLIGRTASVTVSVSTHVPKPHTPFQWCAMDERDEVLRKQQLLRDAARRAGVELKMHDSLGSFIEGVIARGDRSLSEVIYGAYMRGARFDSWEEQLSIPYWRAAFEAAGVEPGRFLGTLPTAARLPWDHIHVGLADGFLAREYRKALKDRLSPPCGKAVGMFVHHTNLEQHAQDQRKLVCYHCGVACDMDQMRTERGEFLVKLGSLVRRPEAEVSSPSPSPSTTTAASTTTLTSTSTSTDETASPELAAPPKKKKPVSNRRQPPVRPDQGEGVRVRLGYRKLGRAAFSSHLDLVRLLPRLFRRLQLPIYYSLGFHSKPVMVFGPALSLGVASLNEYVDLKLVARDEIDWASLPERLTEGSVSGIEFFQAMPLSNGDPKLSSMIHEAEYVAGLSRAGLAELGYADESELAAVVAARSGGELRTRRMIEGIGKWVDVHRYLSNVEVFAGGDTLEAAGIGGDLVPLRFRVRITGEGSAKASEVLETLLDRREVPARVVRASLGWQADACTGTPFELERFKLAQPVRPVTPGSECATEDADPSSHESPRHRSQLLA